MMKNGPEGTKYGVSDSSWMGQKFRSWFKLMFIPKWLRFLCNRPSNSFPGWSPLTTCKGIPQGIIGHNLEHWGI